jgi:4-amino-4-deoxy-L-arabinose transferase-like glycosyltransferase
MRTLGLAAVLGLAGLLNLVGLDREGFGNQYYAAAVWSMLQNWHNFFFVSFDPGGFVSVDKPPFGFWVQVASARLLGFSGLSILLPQALAGVAGVAVLYHLVRRAFGSGAGLLAGLMLALTPVSVSTARNNTIDTLLVLEVLLAAWATVRAAESGRLGWLLLAAALVGLGFETKMLEAYLVVPALGLVYLLAAPRRRLVRLGHLILAGAVLLSVSFAWPMAVDLTPASQRPWVDSTQTDSAVDLALGYNGIQRLLGRGASLQGVQAAVQAARGTGGTGGYAPAARGASGETGGYASGGRVGTGGNGGFGSGGPGATGGNSGFGFGGPGGAGENGPASPLRLLNPQLGGQASWLLPLAILGLLMTGRLAWTRRRGLSRTRRGQAAILWGTWLLPTGAFFSVAQYFHRYYLVMLAPSVAALAGQSALCAAEAPRRPTAANSPGATASTVASVAGRGPTAPCWPTWKRTRATTPTCWPRRAPIRRRRSSWRPTSP